jgi:hypothetical protein
MDNLVVLHTIHALNLLRILLRLLGNQLLQVLNCVLQLYSLSLTCLELLIPLVQLGLEVVNVVLRDGQLVSSVLQPCMSVVKEVGLEITTAISPHQLIVQLLDTCLKAVVLLKELSVALLNVFDETVLGRHLVVILLPTKALVGASHRDLLKHGAHVLGVACHERPPQMVSRTLGVTNDGQALTPCYVALILNGEQGNSGADEARQVALTKLREGLVGSPLQSVVEVIACSHGEPSHDALVGGVSRDIHVDLAASTPELTVWAVTVCGSPHVAEMVQHVQEQDQETGTVQPVTMKTSISSDRGIGVVVHLSKTREK